MFGNLYRTVWIVAALLFAISIIQDVTGVDLATELNPSTHFDRLSARYDAILAGY